ncbi:MAG: hypothetical protein HYX34_10925 [Actinobacteria bacterium]|nr:hypothetical protein [Actinomycetota bacterium]
MRTLAAALAGAAAAALLWAALRGSFDAARFGRENVRGAVVPVGAGIVIALAVLAVTGIDAAVVAIGADRSPLATDPTVLLAALGFGLLGFVDDIAEVGADKGFRGHARALREGRLTTGGLKLLGGGLLAAILVAPYDRHRPGWFLVDAVLVALAANLANLLDRAPGRCAKVGVAAGVAVILTGLDVRAGGLAVVVGATAALLVPDLRERLMLGDAGANVIGGCTGFAVVVSTGRTGRVAVLVALVALNALSEVVSFSRLIDRTPPLRALDRLGRVRTPPDPPARPR